MYIDKVVIANIFVYLFPIPFSEVVGKNLRMQTQTLL